ncbi:hypothetical protein FLACOL_01883 [Flavobacterium columnare]|uniref:Lipoprotein n=2 Tax=Flavobacterium TaxID=237 RepID=A0ABW8PPV5_9FLAO|nr:hypothetical protein [Flavobacterium columnare]SPE77873.1 hypothetical protein FLACOL_01883 [Flavobacterium columnare]
MKIISKNKLEIFLVFFYTMIFIGIFYSCNHVKENKFRQRTKRIKKEKRVNSKKNKINPYDVVIIIPTQKQLDSLQLNMSEDEYLSFIDDNIFYINEAKEYCENIHSIVQEIESGKPLNFITKKGIQFPISTKGLLWEIIVFNGVTPPEYIDCTNLQQEIMSVYNKSKNE